MLIKKLFIHIPKNAGMTIRRSDKLLDSIYHVSNPQDLISPQYVENLKKTMVKSGDAPNMNATSAAYGYGHCRWRDIKPSVRTSMDCFAVVRNPWDRVVSRYFFAKKLIEHEKKAPASKHDISSFEAFLEERHKWGEVEYMWHRAVRGWYPQLDYVTDKDGNLKCDVMRFEKLDKDICFYFKIMKMTEPRNVTGLNKQSYKDLYTKETIQIVADWYQKDIDFWGFDFDTGATKNVWSKW